MITMFSKSTAFGGRVRLQSGGLVSIKLPSAHKWEMYRLTDGLEMFAGYANPNETRVLNKILKSMAARGLSHLNVTGL